MEIPDEMLKEIRESGYDQELVYNYIRELLDSEKRKFPKENNNLELIDNYLLDKDVQEPAAEILMASELIDNYLLDKDIQEPVAEIQMAAEVIDNYLLDKRFMRELEDRDEYDAA